MCIDAYELSNHQIIFLIFLGFHSSFPSSFPSAFLVCFVFLFRRSFATMVLELLFYHCAFLDPSLNRPILSAEDRKRRDRRTPRLAIRRYSESSFVYLFKSGCNQALLNCCGVDHKVFRQLVTLFAPVFNRYTFDKNTGKKFGS